MADDVLLAKLYNYICGSGGFVELAVLLKPPSPLGCRKTKPEAKEWLTKRGSEAGFVCVTDHDDEIIGVRIDLRKKICHQYEIKGSCRRAQGKCKYWHICKSFIEGVCDGQCGLSHSFHCNDDNRAMTKELGLEKHPNGTIRNIVAWSLPQVCQLYLKNECKSDKCPYVHVCSRVVQGSTCECVLSHNLSDSHNIKILKQYDLVPHKGINVDFVRCSILDLKNQKCIETKTCTGGKTVTRQTTPVVVNGKQGDSLLANKQTPAVSTVSKQDPPPKSSVEVTPARKLDDNGLKAKVLFECLCKEFNCLAPLSVLKSRKYVNEPQDVSLFLEENRDKFLFTRNENDNIQDVIAFCPKLRLCSDFVSLNECEKEHCPSFHLCRKFITGSCSRGEKCPRNHKFRNKRDQQTVMKLDLDWLTNDQLRQLMVSSSPQVCISYNKGTCTNESRCPRVHMCKNFVMNSCKNEDACRFQHNGAFGTPHTKKLLEKYRLGKISHNSVLKAILVCEEDSDLKVTTPALHSNLPPKNARSEDLTVSSHNMPSSKARSVLQERRPSTSSSSSSVKAFEKLAPSKKAVLACISKEYSGTVSFEVIAQRRDLFPKHDSGNIAAWFRNRKESFRLVEKGDGTILEVNAFCQRTGFCFNYTSQTSCTRNDCQYFHVCREYIAGVCKFGSRCKWNHSFQFDQDRKFLSKLEVDDLTDEELCKVIQLSMPHVCLKYNDGECQNGESCSSVHVCKDFVKKKCLSTNICGLEHEDALASPHASAILVNYGLKYTDGNLNFILNTLLVCKRADKASKQMTSKAETSAARDSPKQFSHIPSQPSSAEFNEAVSSLASRAVRTPCLPAEQTVFEALCRGYSSSAAFSEIADRKDLFPHGRESAESWFRKTKGSFLLTESAQGTISQVDAFSARARLCLRYNKNGKCDKHDCTYLHVCKDFITDSCMSGVTCPLNHHFHNQRDKALLSRIKLDQFTDSQLRRLVVSSTPQICVEYNNGVCNRGDSCTKIHMCCGLLRKCCSGEYECGLDHEAAMHTGQTRKVLERFILNDVSKRDILEMILDDKLSLSGKDKTKCHIHRDNPDAFICSNFLIAKCNKGLRCKEHHCAMPYHWQYRVTNFDEWKSFGTEDILRLEKLYCEVNTEKRVKFKPAQSLDVSRLERGGCLPRDKRYEVVIDLDDMTITFQKTVGDVSFLGELRRLSTVSYSTCPCDPMVTNWKWYWKENGNVWYMYDKDNSGRDLQGLLEQAFQKMLDQGYTRATYKFNTSEHAYNLFLNSTRDMYQVNLKTGTKRLVKRRPEKAISNEDLDDVKWVYGDSSVRRQIEKRTANSFIPSHWSSMLPSAQHTRVQVDTHSAEFNDVEQLFRKTMNDQAVIQTIERVQNPFMWEKYWRKKENMKVIAQRNQQQVNEKNLFHGTSPGTVEAICKQNFDWRLHGKNATKFGEGSYFAVNASYSHAYAIKDANLSQFMFLAKVLVGSYTKGHSSYRRPPQKDPSNPASDLYDSCVDNPSNPTIFVVFDTDQFYPEYIIKYVFQTTSDFSNSTPQPKPVPSRKPASSQLQLPRRSSNIQSTASNPSGSSSVKSGYSSTASSSGLASGNPPNRSNNLGTGSTPSGSASGSSYQSTVNQTASPFPGAAPVSKPPSSQTYPQGILKHRPSSSGFTSGNPPSRSNNLGTGSDPSGSSPGISYQSTVNQTASPFQRLAPVSKATTSQTYLQGILKHQPSSSNNPSRASTPSSSAAQSGYSASTASRSGITSVSPTKSLNNPVAASTPSRSAAQGSYTASTAVSNSGLTGVNPTRSSPGAAPNPGGSVARGIGYSSSVFSSGTSAYNTSGSYSRSVASSTNPYSSTSSRGLYTATTDTNQHHAKKKKKDCVIA